MTANGLNTRFVYDGGQLTGEVDANGVMIRRYVPLPGPDETLAMYDSTGVSYPLADSRGTPMAWALANGQVAVQGYGAFGEEGGSNIGRFGFTGQMRLPEIGLDSYKARFYDPLIGRFMTPDPAGMVDGPNLYAYVLNDPVNFTDPSGLYLVCAVSAGGFVGTCTEVPDNPPGRGGFIGQNDANGGNNGGRGPGSNNTPTPMMIMRMMEMMCPVGSNAAAVSQALANSSGNLRAQQEIFRNYTNERSGELFAEASGLYAKYIAGTALGGGLIRAAIFFRR